EEARPGALFHYFLPVARCFQNDPAQPPRLLARQLQGKLVEHFQTGGKLVDGNELVRLVRLFNRAGPTDDRGDAGRLKQARLSAERYHVGAVGAGQFHDDPARLGILNDLQPLDLRSEEHTSELQSRENLVCRLLLEKKKKTHMTLMY